MTAALASLPPSSSDETSSLRSDTRGAVMFLGIFMGASMIGSVWSLLGIGNAILQREAAQQAADSAAFSSSVMQARGLNGIAAINLFMIALVALYLIIRTVAYILILVGKILLAGVYTAAIGAALINFGNMLDNVGDGYLTGIKPVMKGLSAVQTASATISSYLGQAAGLVNSLASKVGNGDQLMAFTVGPSSFSGASGIGAGAGQMMNQVQGALSSMGGGGGGFGGLGGGGENKEKLGLPVVHQKNEALCDKAFDMLKQAVMKQVQKAPIIGSFMSYVAGAIMSALKYGATALFCNENDDSFWGENGPKNMYKPSSSPEMKNGSDWNQTYAIVPSQLKDESDKRVGVAAYKFGTGMVSPSKLFYTAQAESYFDCNAKWDDTQCNGKEGDNDGMDGAISNMKWRVRLVRVRSSQIAGLGSFFQSSMLTGQFGEMLNGLVKNVPGAGDALGKLDLGKQITGAANGALGGDFDVEGAGKDMGKALFNSLFQGQGGDLSGLLDGSFDPKLMPGVPGMPGGMFH